MKTITAFTTNMVDNYLSRQMINGCGISTTAEDYDNTNKAAAVNLHPIKISAIRPHKKEKLVIVPTRA
jgi:hypothetical protein